MSHTKDGWIRCSKHKPCPICERPDWCTISPDESLACCMRVESDWPVRNGGWIHRLTDGPVKPSPHPYHTPKSVSDEPQFIDCDAMLTQFKLKTREDAIRQHAERLGVGAASLYRLGIAWAAPHKAWAFPMFNPLGKIIGIRLRAEDGSKWAVTGSRQGLFWPDMQRDKKQPVYVCEGPTDTAAMIDLGFYAIGRPSCSGCVDMLVDLLKTHDVVIVGDRDTPKTRPDGTVWYPGKEGAERLADSLVGEARSVKIMYPPAKFKDARAWRQAGATHELIEEIVAAQTCWRPPDGR